MPRGGAEWSRALLGVGCAIHKGSHGATGDGMDRRDTFLQEFHGESRVPHARNSALFKYQHDRRTSNTLSGLADYLIRIRHEFRLAIENAFMNPL